MAEITKIVANDFDAIFEKFLKDDDPRLDRSDWIRLFQPVCRKIAEPEYGYKLTHDGQIVGMLGMIQSLRTIERNPTTFCNLHSWFVDEQHRGHSLALIRPVLKQKTWVVTDFTPTPAVVELSKRLGFQTLQHHQRILIGKAKQNNATGCKLTWNEDVDLNRLQPEELEIFADHSKDTFHRLMVETADDYCLLVLRRIEFGWQPYVALQYGSNPSVLAETQSRWQNEIQRILNVKKILGSRRHFGCEPLGSRKVSNEPNQLFRSSVVGEDQIDMLYSEVSLLGLSTLPGRKDWLKQAFGKLNPMMWIKK